MSGGRPRLLGRIAFTLALTAFAGIVLGSGLDRASRSSPQLERLVPGPFRAQADRSAAIVSISREDYARALEESRPAVLSDPADPDSTSLLAVSLLMQEQFEDADAAFRVAAQYGWRNVATQLYWFDSAIALGEMDLASKRADAVLRTNTAFTGAEELLQPLEEDVGGRAALIRLIRQQPVWLESYLNINEDTAGEIVNRRVAVLEEMAADGAGLPCNVAAPFVETLLKRADRIAAGRIWNANCPQVPVGEGVMDTSFDLLASKVKFPFGWNRQSTGDVRVGSTRGSDGNSAVLMRNDASTMRLALEQPVTLEPGQYRVVGTVNSGDVPTGGLLVASAGCDGHLPYPSAITGDLAEEGQFLKVDKCDRQMFGIWIRPGGQNLQLGNLRVERVGRQS